MAGRTLWQRTGLVLAALAGLVLAPAGGPALAQTLAQTLTQTGANPFAPVVQVNGRGISGHEITQRMRLLALFRTPGDLETAARQALIDERVQLFAAARAGVLPSAAAIDAGVAEFAGRSGRTAEELLALLDEAGIDRRSFRDFVEAGLAWRDLVRQRFLGRATVTEAEIDRALDSSARLGTAELRLAEIVLPARTAEEAARSEDLAARIRASITTFDAFSEAAGQFSVSPTRTGGGLLPEPLRLETLPPALGRTLMALRPGEITEPLALGENVLVLFQMRGITDAGLPDPGAQELRYAEYLLPGAAQPATRARAEQIIARADTCADLHALALERPGERLRIDTRPAGQVPADLARVLALLDADEARIGPPRGDDLPVVMLCARTPLREEPVDRNRVRDRLVNERLALAGAQFLAELRAAAIILPPEAR